MAISGINERTGRPLSGWPYVVQSAFKILRYRIGTRRMLRSFGSLGLSLLGRRMTPQVVALYRLLTVVALEKWLPNVKVRRVQATATADDARAGYLGLIITVDYLPNGHLGDNTVAATRDIEV